MPKKFIPEKRNISGAFHFIGISCHCRDYLLCFYLHKYLDTELARQDDFKGHAFFYCKDENDFNRYFLLGNRGENAILIPEFRQMDFLLIIEGPFRKAQRDHFIKKIKEIPNVLLPFEIKVESIKNAEIILDEIELHINQILNTKPTHY